MMLVVEYDGTHFAGFQRQKDQRGEPRTIQGTLEEAIMAILKEEVKVVGAGRTDAGVHALGQVVNFLTRRAIPETRLPFALNSVLPPDVVVKASHEVPVWFNARIHARRKLYRYSVLCAGTPSAFLRDFALFVSKPLCVEAMREAAKHMVGTKDFSSFANAGSKMKSNVRTVSRCEILQQGELLEIWVEGDGFLYKMVRTIVGTLLEVGRGKFSPGRVEEVLAARDRCQAGPTVSARGLCLVEVGF